MENFKTILIFVLIVCQNLSIIMIEKEKERTYFYKRRVIELEERLRLEKQKVNKEEMKEEIKECLM